MLQHIFVFCSKTVGTPKRVPDERERVHSLRDELSRLRRALPWEKAEKRYAFDATRGTITLAELFDGRSQLMVYHFMFAPGWQEGCPRS
jgi:predicted dithiol-disulfide oxidoreductase (DUF899 family)